MTQLSFWKFSLPYLLCVRHKYQALYYFFLTVIVSNGNVEGSACEVNVTFSKLGTWTFSNSVVFCRVIADVLQGGSNTSHV